MTSVWRCLGEHESDGSDDYRVPLLEVEDAIREACKRYRVREVVADPYRLNRSLQVLAAERIVDTGHAHTVIVTEGRRVATEVRGARWVNVVLANVKRSISGTYHAIKQAALIPTRSSGV